MKILIADDHALMREGIQLVLSRVRPDLEFFEASNFDQTISVLHEQPDLSVIFLDLCMPDEVPFVGLEKVMAVNSDIPVIVISASENPENMLRAIKLGAKGYIPKSSSNEVMVAALELVLSGGVYCPERAFEASGNAVLAVSVTRRQREVLTLLAAGQSNKEIARNLGLSEGTVRTHLTALFKLLEVNNRTQASNRAQALDLLDKD